MMATWQIINTETGRPIRFFMSEDAARLDAALKVLIEKHWVYEVKDGGVTRIMLNPKARGAR